jgi:hypothetical protein
MKLPPVTVRSGSNLRPEALAGMSRLEHLRPAPAGGQMCRQNSMEITIERDNQPLVPVLDLDCAARWQIWDKWKNIRFRLEAGHWGCEERLEAWSTRVWGSLNLVALIPEALPGVTATINYQNFWGFGRQNCACLTREKTEWGSSDLKLYGRRWIGPMKQLRPDSVP